MAVEVFTYAPQVEARAKIRLPRHKTQFGDGYSQTMGDGIATKTQAWDLEFRGDASLISGIRDFLDAHGGWRSFLWTPPLGVQGHYQADEYQFVDRGANRYLLSVTFTFTAEP